MLKLFNLKIINYVIKWVLLSFVVKRYEENKVEKVRNREKCNKLTLKFKRR